jgi:protoheme ferro-lyase
VKRAALLLAHGAPERLEDVESYLTFVRGGRPGSLPILDRQTGHPALAADIPERLRSVHASPGGRGAVMLVITQSPSYPIHS